ncbi:MAG: hypothetical protein A4E20_10910 [Nitrospira sp. SG-bin2]|uniref:phage fiber-tail adaptor protein n=1 Tax=Nitrospira cf. moscoviensis SBR1015 TaxID=96242 RepID=UPI000A0DBEE6|nr:hypothetical protein [Nitrospira cf. moscoviensis SBR1015]OQW34522.1 MAG: hypothetical protein A4E20_10910 [Nitrospira sp. SG-bin2]
MAKTFTKDPEAILDYSVDWSKWLVSDDYLVHATFVPSPGLSVISSNVTETIATVWLSGGIAGQTYSVTCHITTNGGRQDDRTFQILAKEM